MANAGYDPRELANVFRTLEAQGGGGGGFLSDHPSRSHRYARINQEAEYLRVQNRFQDDRQFYAINERLRGYPRAQTMAEIQRSGRRYPNQGGDYPNGDRAGYPNDRNGYPNDRNGYPNDRNGYPNDRNGYPNAPRGRLEYPSTRYRSYNQARFS